jgi:uncharacterized protein (UPF0332 family)
MRENSWEECMENSSAYTVSADKAKAKSLFNTAVERINFLKENKLNERNGKFIFEGYYSSLIEVIHALVLLKRYKVTNHLCLGHYIRDVMKKEDLFRIFDDCRIKRNDLVYYGKSINLETAKQSILKAEKLIEEISKSVKKEL